MHTTRHSSKTRPGGRATQVGSSDLHDLCRRRRLRADCVCRHLARYKIRRRTSSNAHSEIKPLARTACSQNGSSGSICNRFLKDDDDGRTPPASGVPCTKSPGVSLTIRGRSGHITIMNDVDFFAQTVQPTGGDFSKNPGDIRLGILACLVLQAMDEHWFRHNKSDLGKVHNCTTIGNFKGALRVKDKAFGWIMDIAMALNMQTGVLMHDSPARPALWRRSAVHLPICCMRLVPITDDPFMVE